MIGNVYSYYLSQYAVKPGSRHDSHKKSELRSVYNRMVSINRTSPLYKLDLSENMQKLAIDIKESAIELKNLGADLDDAEKEGETFYEASSSDDSKVSVDYISDDKPPVDFFNIEVKQLASNQVNVGNYLLPKEKYFNEGAYSFDVSIKDVTYELQFNVDRRDTNADVQDKIKRLINNSNIGLTADVLTDSLGNTALSVESDSTGLNGVKTYIFNITETSGNEDAGVLSHLGINRIVKHPGNAIFSVDGRERSSANNRFTINKAYDITLKEVTDNAVSISTAEKEKPVYDEIDRFVNGYNRILEFANNVSEKSAGGAKLLSEFENISRSYRQILEGNGIDVSDEGRLSVSEEAKNRLSDREISGKMLSDIDNFKKTIIQKTDKIISNPIEYLDKKIVAYKNPARSFASPYNSSVYAGIMFDGYY